jgi:hypothetical protein
MEVQLPPWTEEFQQCHQEWAQGAYLSPASPLNIVQKQRLLWFSYNFYKRNSHYITPEKFFYKGGTTWEDQIFKFWWDYICSPESINTAVISQDKVLHLLPPWIFNADEYDILEYLDYSDTWKNKTIPSKAMIPALLISSYIFLGPFRSNCSFVDFYTLTIDGGLSKLTHLANAMHEKLGEAEASWQRPITLVSWKDTLKRMETTPTEDLNLNQNDMMEFDIHFHKWWHKHDSSKTPQLPDATIQRHNLFHIFLQLSKAGFSHIQDPKTFFLHFSENSFRQIQSAISAYLPISTDQIPTTSYFLQVPMCDPDDEMFKLILQAVNGCQWLQDIKDIYPSHDLIPEFLHMALLDDPHNAQSQLHLLLNEGSMSTLAILQHKIRTKKALHSCEQGSS